MANTPISMLCVIVARGSGEEIDAYLRMQGYHISMILRGRGTVNAGFLETLGLKDNHKDVVLCTMPKPDAQRMTEHLDMHLAIPGTGIAFVIDLSSVGGRKTYDYLLENVPDFAEEANNVPKTTDYEMIIAIIARGFSDLVMDAARSAGARGGTILHARGTGANEVGDYFGVSIQPEKELVMILCESAQKNGIMTAIMKEAGMSSQAHGLVFSIPVDNVAGLGGGKNNGKQSGKAD